MSFRYKAGFIQYFFNPLTAAGSLYSWGENTYGQLGNNTTIPRSSPVQISSTGTWSNIAGGSYHAISTKSDGTLWAWGFGGWGQLGQGNIVYRSSPVQVGALTTWGSIACGANFSASIKTDGTLWMWGRNTRGQLGDNTAVAGRSSPIQVGAGTTWLNVAAGFYHTVATKTDGTMWSWGSNSWGELGQNNRIYRSSPVQIGALTTWLSVSSGAYQVFAKKSDGTMWSWGRNNLGSLGLNNTIGRSSPVQIGALTTWSKPSANQNYSTYAIKTDGTLWSWGGNDSGQLGYNNLVYTSSPTQVGSNTNWSNVYGGTAHIIAIQSTGDMFTCGYNNVGQLGDSTLINRSSPIQVGSGSTWLSAGATAYASFGIPT